VQAKQWVASAIAFVAAMLLVLTGCQVATHSTAAYSAVKNKAVGAGVTVTGSKVPSAIKAVTTSGVKVTVPGFTASGQAFSITPSGNLSASATLCIPLGKNHPAGSTVVVATSENSSGPWTLEMPTVSADGKYAIVDVSHFSFHVPGWLNPSKLVGTLETEAKSVFGGDVLTQAPKPHCDNDSQAQEKKDGYAIVSSNRDTLYWCFGIEGGQHVLKIVNRMRYPLEVQHPGLTVKDLGGPRIDLDQMARLGSGQTTILYPFEQATYIVGSSDSLTTRVGISTDFSGYAQSLYQLQFGLEVLVDIIIKLHNGAPKFGDKLGAADFSDISEQLDKALQLKDCDDAFIDTNFEGMAAHCLVPLVKDEYGLFGQAVSGVMLLGSTVEFFRSEFDSAFDQIDHRSQYQIAIGRAGATGSAVPSQFVGHFGGDLSGDTRLDLTVKANGTGTLKVSNVDGPCSTAAPSCVANASLAFKANGNTLTGTVTSVRYTTESGQALPIDEVNTQGMPHVGDTLHLTAVPSQHILQSAKGDPDYGTAMGRTAWCGDGVMNVQYCGPL
jgi:hypothetical protein